MSLEELKKEIDAVGSQIAAAKKEISDKDEVKKVIGPLIPKLWSSRNNTPMQTVALVSMESLLESKKRKSLLLRPMR